VKYIAVALATVAIAVAALRPPPQSGANLTARTTSTATAGADSASRYVHLYSETTDPAGLTGYAVKSQSSPSVLAATGSDSSLALALGGWKNGGTMNRVLTIEAPSSLPVASITVTAVLPATPATPVTAATFAALGSTGGTASVTLTAGAKRQVNLAIGKLAGNNAFYPSNLLLRVTYTGFTSSFLTYTVPMSVWDGNGSGP
jgi:hypothetical protein